MKNTVSAQEIKRRGISAVDEALRNGPVHVIRRNRPSYVILTEEHYERLVGQRESVSQLWDQLLAGMPPGRRSEGEILRRVQDERAAWDP